MSTSQSQAINTALDPEQWVDEYGDLLFRYAQTRLRDANTAEELVQDTFLAGIHHQRQFLGKGTQRSWLVGILRRKIVDYIRRRVRQNEQQPQIDEPDPTEQLFDKNGRWKPGAMQNITPDQKVQSQELWRIVRACLEHLPQGQADVFVLSVMEEMKTKEICKELDISTSNLGVRMHRARLGLAKCVGARWLSADEQGREYTHEGGQRRG